MATTTTVVPTNAPEHADLVQPGSAGWRAARAMSVLVLVLMPVESMCGLWVAGLYRDPPPVAVILRGYDLVTLVITTPALALALLPAWRRHRLAQLVWLSTVAYGVYNYAIYVFGTAFNALFLVHVALFGLSVFALGLGLATVDVKVVAAAPPGRVRVRVVGALLVLLATALAGMWIVGALRFAITGALPQDSDLVLPPAAVHLGYVLDLALYAPACVLAGVLLWQHQPWGYLLGAVTLLFGTLYQLCYVSALLFQAAAHLPGASGYDPAEPVIIAVFVTATVLLLAHRHTPAPR